MILVVTGGRSFNDRRCVFEHLDAVAQAEDVEMVVHGGADGADRLADQWAMARAKPCARFPARWQDEGRSAGPRRNGRMLTWANSHGDGVLLVAFPGGAGTMNCIFEAEKREIEVRRVLDERMEGSNNGND